MDDTSPSWNIGDTFARIAAGYFDYRKATDPNQIRWVPGASAGGPGYGVGVDGVVYQRGSPVNALAGSSGYGSLLIVAVIVIAGFFAVRALK